MARACTICNHPKRDAINASLTGSTESIRGIARHFAVSEDALTRHKTHIPKALTLARQAEEITKADSLLDHVQDLQARALTILNTAEKSGDLKSALGGIREARACLELLAKLRGELDERPVVNLTVNPVWLETRAVLITALAGFPEARESVARALEAVNA
jgi:hypothetical protein